MGSKSHAEWWKVEAHRGERIGMKKKIRKPQRIAYIVGRWKKIIVIYLLSIPKDCCVKPSLKTWVYA